MAINIIENLQRIICWDYTFYRAHLQWEYAKFAKEKERHGRSHPLLCIMLSSRAYIFQGALGSAKKLSLTFLF
jgi:hypothetical protein